jgi:hypothetical protein
LTFVWWFLFLYPHSPKGEGGILFYLCPSVLPSVQDIFRRIFLSNCWWQKSDIWSQASYRYTILWVAFLDPSDSYFLFADLVGFYTHWTYMHIFRHIFLSNYWWQKSDIWSQASYRYPISWEAFLDPSDSYFLFADLLPVYFQKSSDIADEIIEPQPLWEYPCCARSDVQQVFTFDYNDFVNKKSLPYKIETKLNINR